MVGGHDSGIGQTRHLLLERIFNVAIDYPFRNMAKSRTSKSALFRMIQQSSIPIYAVSTEMKIVFCNEALCQLTGHENEFLTDLTCVYQSAVDEPPSRQIATGLCPPPDSFSGEPITTWVTIPVKDTVQFRQALFVPNRQADESPENSIAGVIVFVFGEACTKPDLDLTLDETPDFRVLHAAISQMQSRSTSSINIDRLVGISPLSARIRRQVSVAGETGVNVTITGPRGSGRRSIVPLIHFAEGPEMAGPLIPINCPLSDMESVQDTIKTLYRSQKKYPNDPLGRVFLQDVDQLTRSAQMELLGFLKLPDFRLPLIATASPEPMNLHPELWQFLSTIVIEIPALKDRREDIPYLAQAIVEQFNDAHHSQLAGIENETMESLVRYSWPGELDELTEAVDIACRAASPPWISLKDFPQNLRIALRTDQPLMPEQDSVIDLDQFLAEIEEELILRAVAHTGGNKSKAARLLNISRPRLLRRLDGSGQPENQAADGNPDSCDKQEGNLE